MSKETQLLSAINDTVDTSFGLATTIYNKYMERYKIPDSYIANQIIQTGEISDEDLKKP